MPSSRPRGSQVAKWAKSYAIIPVLLVFWELLSRSGLINSRLFPPPSEIAVTIASLTTDGFPTGITAWTHVGASALRIVVGFLFASLVAIPLGVILGRSPWLRRFSDPVVGFSRSIAALALLPLFVAWFGVGELTRLLLVAYAAFWIVLVNTTAAVLGVDPVYEEAATALGANRRQVFIQVTLMAALPRIFTGLKVATGVAFLVIVAVEMVGTEKGVGALISEAQTFFRSDIAISGMVFIAAMGILLATLMDVLERTLLPWRKGLEEQR
jgi:ABC-type nitrate/sulfonate/bicarbonate transport system permease component